MTGRWTRQPGASLRLWEKDLEDLEVDAVSTASRDGSQGNKIAEKHTTRCEEIMMDRGIEHVLDCVAAGITTFDIGSLVDEKHVRTTSNLEDWLKEAKDKAREQFGVEIHFQILILNLENKDNDFLKRAKKLHRAGVLDSLAYVHSHDHRFLGENHIRRILGERLIPKGTPESAIPEILDRYEESIMMESHLRLHALTAFARTLGVPLNIYLSNATGTRDRETNKPILADLEKVLKEIRYIFNMGLLPGSRIIISETEAVGTEESIRELMEELVFLIRRANRIKCMENVTEIGIHPHIANSKTPEEVTRIVRAFIDPLIGKVKKVFLEVGFAGLGGCIILDEPSKNLPCSDAIEALKEVPGVKMQKIDESKLPEIDEHVATWNAELKALAPEPKTSDEEQLP